MTFPARIAILALAALGLAAGAQEPKAPLTPDQRRELRRQSFASARELMLRSGVPFDPDELLSAMWTIRLKDALDAMPQMHESRYVTNPLSGVYIADTLYLPERVEMAGEVVILADHVVIEGKKPVMRGYASIHMFRRYPMETLGKSLRDTLHDAGLPMPAAGQPAPSFGELVKRLGLDPYRHGKKYAQVFEPVVITIDVSGKPGLPGKNGEPGEPGGTDRYNGKMGDASSAVIKPKEDVLPPPPK